MTVRRIPRLCVATLIMSGFDLPAHAQTLGQGTDTDVPWLRLLAALAVCVALAFVAVWALKARMNSNVSGPRPHLRDLPWLERFRQATLAPPRPGQHLNIVETLHLSNNASVSLLQCDGRSFILASTPQGGLVLVSVKDISTQDDVA